MRKTVINNAVSEVSFCKVKEISKDGVISTVKKAITLAKCGKLNPARKIFVKVNLLSQEVVPGQCTSPWVFEGVLQYLRMYEGVQLYYGDCDVAAASQVEKAVVNWGLKEIGDKYEATFLNLSQVKQKEVYLGPVLRTMSIPAPILNMDAIITAPVVKTHCITPFTGALKNQWGLLPRARFQYHDVVHQAIAEINSFFNRIVLGIADLTIAMEGPGPRVGIPKVCNRIMASTDLVALDSLIASYMGFDPQSIDFIKNAENLGVGSTDYRLVGDSFEKNPFERGKGKDYFIYRWRDRFKKIPIFRDIIFTVPLYRALGYVATKYNLWAWYNKIGKKLAIEICKKSDYGQEFEKLICKCPKPS